jgi:ligand-binding sensor domain-containing protein
MSGSQPRRLWIAFLIGLALPAHSQAQKPTDLGMPVLHNYSSKDSNVPNQVWSIIQDRRGVLFFGGTILSEYDGVTWRRVPTPSNVVRSLAMDSTGKIWIGLTANFGYLEPDANGTLRFVSLLEKIPQEHRAFNDVWQILITPQGNFFRAYERLFRWDGKTMHAWTTNTRFQALAEIRGHFYTSQAGIGLEEIVGDELRAVPGGDAYKDSTKLSLYPYDDGRILVSARGGTLTLYDGQKVTPFPTQADDYLKKNEVYTYNPLPDGSLCVNTLRGGAVILEHDGRLRRILGKDTGLQDPSVLSTYSDHEGGLWLGLSSGVTRVEIDSQSPSFPGTPSLTLQVIKVLITP